MYSGRHLKLSVNEARRWYSWTVGRRPHESSCPSTSESGCWQRTAVKKNVQREPWWAGMSTPGGQQLLCQVLDLPCRRRTPTAGRATREHLAHDCRWRDVEGLFQPRDLFQTPSECVQRILGEIPARAGAAGATAEPPTTGPAPRERCSRRRGMAGGSGASRAGSGGMISAWCTRKRMVLLQCTVADKPNEIHAHFGHPLEQRRRSSGRASRRSRP